MCGNGACEVGARAGCGVEDVSLTVGAGETVALLGTNGNGKSTLIKCIMGIVRPSAGRIVAEIDGESHELTRMATEQIVDLEQGHEGAGAELPAPARERRGEIVVESVAAGQHDIEQDRVERSRGRTGQAVDGVACALNLIPFGDEAIGERHHQTGFVFDQQHSP